MRARGRARRELLLNATLEIIAEKGISAVTHRSVAAAAGVPHSSTTYFFDSLDDMIGEAVAHAMAAEFERLQEFLTGAGTGTYRKAASDLGMTEDAVKVAVHRLRHRYGEMLRKEVEETVADPAQVDGEIRYLLAVIGRR